MKFSGADIDMNLSEHLIQDFFLLCILMFQIVNECDRAEQWLRERSQEQDSLPKNTDPVLWSIDIKSVAEDLNS